MTLGPDEIQRTIFTALVALGKLRASAHMLVPHELRTLNKAAVEVIIWTAKEQHARPELAATD